MQHSYFLSQGQGREEESHPGAAREHDKEARGDEDDRREKGVLDVQEGEV